MRSLLTRVALLPVLACAPHSASPPNPGADTPPPAPVYAEVQVPAGWEAAPLRVTLDDGGGGVKLVEVACEASAFRKRVAVLDGQADLGLVPKDTCTLYFKGGAPGQFAPVSGGQVLSCRMVATTALCEVVP